MVSAARQLGLRSATPSTAGTPHRVGIHLADFICLLRNAPLQ